MPVVTHKIFLNENLSGDGESGKTSSGEEEKLTVKGKTGALIAVCAGIAAGVGISGCADLKATPPHEHTYNESEWMQDDAGHWRGATCGHKVRRDYGEHIYDGASDADCNVCGRVRTIEQNKDPAESNGEKPDEGKGATDGKAEGFIIGKNTDGLIVEGISAEYALSTTKRALNFNTLDYAVYLSEKGVKCAEVPRENYKTTVYYGGNEVLTPQELTADGQYTATITLINAVYADGGKAGSDGVSEQINFTIKNGVISFSLTEGVTEQVASANDKMSATWRFEAVRANGDKFTFDSSGAEISAPDTEKVGTRTAIVKYGGAESEIEYTVKPVPEIVKGAVDVTAKDGTDRETDGGFAVISADDFNVEFSVNAGFDYSVGTALFYEGKEVKSLKLEAGEKVHFVTVLVTFTYTVEGETITREYSEEFGITVRKKQEVNLPLIYSGAEIMNGGGTVRLVGQEGFSASVNGGALEIMNVEGEFGQAFRGLVIDVDRPATVKVRIAVADGAFCGISEVGCHDDWSDGQNFEGDEEVTFFIAESGQSTLYVLANNEFDLIVIHGVEIIFEQ
ncbi:MAG: hypothetical protein K2I17_01505 [Clostridia bacterium]|nr:hypothetical protein [Clostridia bacterium]